MKLYEVIDKVGKAVIEDKICEAIILKGSIGRGEEDSYSDIDMYVIVEKERYKEFLANRIKYLRAYNDIIYWKENDFGVLQMLAIYQDGIHIDFYTATLEDLDKKDKIKVYYDPKNLFKDTQPERSSMSKEQIKEIFGGVLYSFVEAYSAYKRENYPWTAHIIRTALANSSVLLRYLYDEKYAFLGLKKINKIISKEEYLLIEKASNSCYKEGFQTAKDCILEILEIVLSRMPAKKKEKFNLKFYEWVKENIYFDSRKLCEINNQEEFRLKKGSKVAIVCCSNGQQKKEQEKIILLLETLKNIGLNPICSPFIYRTETIQSASAKERAKILIDFYKDSSIDAIFDISGGDIANEILPYLDFEIIKKSKAAFWGYSDLTTIINAIYAKTGKIGYLYQIRNLIYADKEEQIDNFSKFILENKKNLCEFSYRFLQGDSMEGIIVGGNIRCLLKLAGTSYWSDMRDKILFLEAYGGETAQMITYFSQLKQLEVFKMIKGVILGTFIKMEEGISSIEEIALTFIEKEIPIVKTKEIGHLSNSKCLEIGKYIRLKKGTEQ